MIEHRITFKDLLVDVEIQPIEIPQELEQRLLAELQERIDATIRHTLGLFGGMTNAWEGAPKFPDMVTPPCTCGRDAILHRPGCWYYSRMT